MSLDSVKRQLAEAEAKAGRDPGSVTLVAVSKVQPEDRLQAVIDAGCVRPLLVVVVSLLSPEVRCIMADSGMEQKAVRVLRTAAPARRPRPPGAGAASGRNERPDALPLS